VSTVEQSEILADQQYIAEEGLDLGLHGRDKGSDGAVVGGVSVGEGDEDNVFLAGAFDLARGDHASGVGEQDDFEQDLGMDGGCANLVVVVTRIKDGEVEVLVHQFADGVLERSWDDLVLQGDWEHDQLIFVEWFEFCHRSPLSYRTLWLCTRFAHLFDSFNGLRYLRWGGGRRSRPTRKMLRRRKLLGICAESPASGARFVSRFLFQG
jgi:hypothetical protein